MSTSGSTTGSHDSVAGVAKEKAPSGAKPRKRVIVRRVVKRTQVAPTKKRVRRRADDLEESRWKRCRNWLLASENKSWSVSIGVHVVLLILLGLMQLSSADDDEPVVEIHSEFADAVDEPLDSIDSDIESLEEPVIIEPVAALEESIPRPEIDIEIDLPALSVSDGDDVQMSTKGKGKKEGNNETGVGVEFFGVKASGAKNIVFVVDNSNSMTQGRFEAACYEVLKSVSKLKPTQRFYVVFYSDTAYPLFYPRSARNLVPATTTNKRNLAAWLNTVQMCLMTRGEKALALALNLQPDTIYILGDGAFTDGAVKKLLARTDSVTIHTMGFDMTQNKGGKSFQQIAAKFNGKFTPVKVPQKIRQLAAKYKRPRNSKPNGIWGVELDKKPKKKKKKKPKK